MFESVCASDTLVTLVFMNRREIVSDERAITSQLYLHSQSQLHFLCRLSSESRLAPHGSLFMEILLCARNVHTHRLNCCAFTSPVSGMDNYIKILFANTHTQTLSDANMLETRSVVPVGSLICIQIGVNLIQHHNDVAFLFL